MSKKLIVLMFVMFLACSKDFTQSDVEEYLRKNSFVTDDEVAKNFEIKDGKYFIKYEKDATSSKYILQPVDNDLQVVFMEKLSSFSFSSSMNLKSEGHEVSPQDLNMGSAPIQVIISNHNS